MSARTLVPAIAAMLLGLTPAFAGGDAVAGKAAFNRCRACHDPSNPVNKLGPYLLGVVGRQAGTAENYTYSQAMIDAGANGLLWDEANIAAYLKAPKEKVPGNRMAFAPMTDETAIANIIAYLAADPKP